MAEVEIPLPEEPIETGEQKIYTATGIMKLVKDKYPYVQALYLFYLKDEVLITNRPGDWNNQRIKTVYFHPAAVIIKEDNKMKKIELDLGDYGVKFTVAKSRRIMDYRVNMLEICPDEVVKGNLIYYEAKTILYRNLTKFMETLKESKKFEFRKAQESQVLEL